MKHMLNIYRAQDRKSLDVPNEDISQKYFKDKGYETIVKLI